MAVPIQSPPPPSYSEKAVQQMEHERQLFADEKFTSWGIIWTLFAFKMATIGIILVMIRNASGEQKTEAMAYIGASTWYWMFIPIVAVSGFVTWRWRLYSARKRAQELRMSEFSTMRADDLAPLTDEEKERLRQLRVLPEHDR
ncbi:MAG: hypothetical protein M9934_13825 [Thermomicrobiales bacterium]|nr:hypothetical protein [Thermomicrobiales bacterium]